MERNLTLETVEGEIALVIDYEPGQARALDVLGGAMALIGAIDSLDSALLSSISSELEPVSILNDVQHSSLKVVLARVLGALPDDHLANLEWKKWIGQLLVRGKHSLLQKLDADAPVIAVELQKLEPFYREAPSLIGYNSPDVKRVQIALKEVSRARASLGSQKVIFQSELGDIILGDGRHEAEETEAPSVVMTRKNRCRELLKVRYPDMLGQAQWTVMRNNRPVKVEILHRAWIEDYHSRAFTILPGDSLDCSFDEVIGYDNQNNEVERKISVVEVHSIETPPKQTRLSL